VAVESMRQRTRTSEGVEHMAQGLRKVEGEGERLRCVGGGDGAPNISARGWGLAIEC